MNSNLNQHWTHKKGKLLPKAQFQSLESALKFMDQCRIDKNSYHPYVCAICGMWHIGHTRVKTIKATFYAVHHYEIIRCHLTGKRTKEGKPIYAANSKRDKRKFLEAYLDIEEARKKAVEYELKMSNNG